MIRVVRPTRQAASLGSLSMALVKRERLTGMMAGARLLRGKSRPAVCMADKSGVAGAKDVAKHVDHLGLGCALLSHVVEGGGISREPAVEVHDEISRKIVVANRKVAFHSITLS